jgi:hypothetical protein
VGQSPAVGVGAGLPCLERKRRTVPHVSCLDATPDEFIMSHFDVGDGQPPSAEPGAAVVSPLPNVIEHPDPGLALCLLHATPWLGVTATACAWFDW